MKENKKGLVIFGVLNWGLGHATRSARLIEELLSENFEVVLASDGGALDYLKQQFPQLPACELPSYKINYGRGTNQLFKLALQLPQIYRAQKKEHQILKKLSVEYQPSGIISDNRLGFYQEDIPSVYITHQLKLMLPFGRKWISGLHHSFIKNYRECWIPDVEGENNLAGEMAHDLKPKVPLKYIGFLSRFVRNEITFDRGLKKYKAVAIISGPENQRTVFEKLLMDQLQKLPGKYLVIRGTKNTPALQNFGNIEVIDFADAETIKAAVEESEIVISRSGYSSLMDYYFLQNKALLIPTPGQPEQEYLARFQLHKGRFAYVAQSELNLGEDLPKAQKYKGFTAVISEEKAVHRKSLFSLLERK